MMSGNHMMTGTPSVEFLIPFATRQARTNWSTACSIYSRPSVPYETRPIKITKSLLPHSCLVPGPPRCCSTTLIQRFAAQFSYLGYELTLSFRWPHLSSQFRQHGWRHWRSHSRVQFGDVPGSYSVDNIHHAKVQEGIHARLTGKIEI